MRSPSPGRLRVALLADHFVEKHAREHDKSTRGNQALASKLLQVSERVVNYKVKKLGIDCRRFRQ